MMSVFVRLMKLTTLRWFRRPYRRQTVSQSTLTTGVWWLLPVALTRSQGGSKTFKLPSPQLRLVLMMSLPIHVYFIQASSQTVCYSHYIVWKKAPTRVFFYIFLENV